MRSAFGEDTGSGSGSGELESPSRERNSLALFRRAGDSPDFAIVWKRGECGVRRGARSSGELWYRASSRYTHFYSQAQLTNCCVK